MGWVTLSLRKSELKQTKTYYQQELLDIAREKRSLDRQLKYDQTCVQNKMKKALNGIEDAYSEQRDTARESARLAAQDGNDVEYDRLQEVLDDMKQKYESMTNDETEYWEESLSMIEEEANQRETELDQRQVEVETQLEVINSEMEAVSSAVSSDVQSSTIKLS